MGKEGDLNNFEHGMVVGDRWAGLTISETADLLVLSSTTISRLYKERKKLFHSIEFIFFKLA